MTRIRVFEVVWNTESKDFEGKLITDGIDIFDNQELWFDFWTGLNDIVISTLINDTRDATKKYNQLLKKKKK